LGQDWPRIVSHLGGAAALNATARLSKACAAFVMPSICCVFCWR